MTENKQFTIADGFKIVAIRDNGRIMNSIQVCDKLNELAEENKQCKEYNAKLYSNSMKSEKQLLKQIKELKEENKKLKRENESLNSQLIRLDNELFCQDCLTCRHSKSINIDVECAEGEKEYHRYCDFYEIEEEWVE